MCRVKSEKPYNNLVQLMNYFADDKVCQAHLEQMRWADGVPTCPRCECENLYRIENGKRYKCGGCKYKFSAKVGTIFENSKISLQKWFCAIYLATSHKKGISSCQLARDLNVEQRTAWFMLHRIRESLLEKEPEALAGEVEVDETYIGGREINKHWNKRKAKHYDNKQGVIGFLQRDGKVRAHKIESGKAMHLAPAVRANVEQGTTLYTDSWSGYRKVGKEYQHHTVSHCYGEYVRGAVHTNSVENFWSHLKRGIHGIYHRVSPKHLDRYLTAYAFRWNTRTNSEADRFDLCLQQAHGRRLKYKQLIAV